MKFRSVILSFALLMILASASNAQRLTHRLGEVIVETSNDRNFMALLKEISSQSAYRQSLSYEKIIDQPHTFYKLSIDAGNINEEEFLQDIIKSRFTLTAQKNHILDYRLKPNDPSYEDQWQYLNPANMNIDIDAEEAWDITTGGVTAEGDTIVVAVIDGGYDQEHEDFQGNIWFNHDEIPDNDIDDDNNGYVDDYAGYSAYNNTDDVSNNPYHGSSVAGIIGARGNNGIGVTGINWEVKLMMIQGGGDEADALKAYSYAYIMRKRYNESNGAQGAFVVATNASWGTDGGDPAEAPIWCDFYNTMGEEGIIGCGATTNEDLNVEVDGDLPTGCTSPYLIGVTNLNDMDSKVTAGYGYKSVDLGAYGEGTFNIRANNNYGRFGGTSGATPHVAGTVALIYSIDCDQLIKLSKSNPARAALAVKDFILNGVVPNEDLMGITTTGGKLNLYNAVKNADNLCSTVCDLPFAVDIQVSGFDKVKIDYNDYSDGVIIARYRKDGTSNWTNTELTTSGEEIALDFCTVYEFQLGKECGGETQYGYSRYIESGGCCYAPVDYDLTFEEEAAVLSWSLEDVYTGFIVQYKAENMTDWIEISVSGEDDKVSLPVTLDNCSFIDVRIKSLCDVVGTESKFSEKRFFSDCGSCQADYCSDFSALDNTGEWISKFEIEELYSRNSGQENDAYFYDGNSGIVFKDSTWYKFNLNVTYGEDPYDERLAIFIDQNYDGIFENSERVYNKIQFRDSVQDSFMIPRMTTYGNTRMRVIMLFDAIGGACKTDDQRFGEVEDYCVEMESFFTCPTSINLIPEDGYYDGENQTFVVDTNAVLSLDIDGYAESYTLQYRVAGDPSFTTLENTENRFELLLEKCVNYEVQLKAQCSAQEFIESPIIPLRAKCYNSSTSDPSQRSTVIYPNPGESFKVDSEDRIDKITIYSITGEMIKEIYNSRNVDAVDLKNGLYIIEIIAEGKKEVHKWMKL